MVGDIIRDGAFGQVARYISKNKLLPYPEERPGFQCPNDYKSDASSTLPPTTRAETPYTFVDKDDKSTIDFGRSPSATDFSLATPGTLQSSEDPEKSLEKSDFTSTPALSRHDETAVDLEKVSSALSQSQGPRRQEQAHLPTLENVRSQRQVQELAEHDIEQALQPTPSAAIAPQKTSDGTILVDWYTTDDQANPQNWSAKKKGFVTAIIMLYTTAVYLAGSIYAPAELGVIEHLGVSVTVASLGLSLYVLGYGLGPLLWSPLSEIPAIGRNPIYIATFAIFTILAVPTALVDNIGGLLVLRFLMGFFGSPALATGGASLQDMFSLIKLPYFLSLWALSACLGPALGPIISGFSVTANNWHWALWEVLWLAGPTFLVMFFFLPETNPSTILLNRARRLRKEAARLDTSQNLMSQSEIDQGKLRFRAVAVEALYRPFQLNFLDPSIAFTSVYTALMYALFYSFFEAFPLVYGDIYHFNLGEQGLAFTSTAIGFGTATIAYFAWLFYWVNPRLMKHGLGPPEERLLPGLAASFFMPIGMFIYGWTARPDIHWIVPSIGVSIVTFGVFVVFQCLFIYLAFSYPSYAASAFAGNDVARSSLAAGAILYSHPLYVNLGIGKGSSLLGSLMAGCIFGIWALWYWGAKLRAKSRFTMK